MRLSGGVAPQSVEEIQALLKIAREFKIPLWPISRGKNFGYGGSAPCMRGTMMLDLVRMNRILEVNEELGYAVLEPGVNFTATAPGTGLCASEAVKSFTRSPLPARKSSGVGA